MNSITLSKSTPRRIPSRGWARVAMLAAVVLLALLPMATSNPFLLTVGTLILLNSIGAVSLHLIVRTGHISMAHAGFIGVGAYACAVSVMRLGVPPILGVFIGAAASGLLALIVGPIILRLTGKYFVLVTFLLGEIIQLILIQWEPVTGGANGISKIPALAPSLNTPVAQYYVVFVAAVLCVGFCIRLLGSEVGRAIDATREAERVTECSGVRVLRLKIGIFVLGSALAGIQGGLLGFFMHYLDPGSFGMNDSLNFVVMNVLGGMYNVVGPLLGTVFLVALPELLRGYVEVQRVIFGLALVMVMAAMPGGLVGLFNVLRSGKASGSKGGRA